MSKVSQPSQPATKPAEGEDLPTPSKEPALWQVYLIRCADDSLYAGITTDVERRLGEHRSGTLRAAKYVKGRGPLTLAYTTTAGSRAEASRIEHQLKQLPKARKEALAQAWQASQTEKR